VGYSFRGKQWLEYDNPYATGMTGLLGYGGAYSAINSADLLLLLGTDFPFSEFLPADTVKKVQIDREPKHIGRRTHVDLSLVGDVKATLTSLLPKVKERSDTSFLEKYLAETRDFYELLNHYVEKGPGLKPIRPEFLAMFFADTGTPLTIAIWT
jgi:pyruvate dehydrogenase (quinone)